MCFLGKRAEDQPKSPSTVNTDLVPLDEPQEEVEEPVGGSAAMAQEILGCHTVLAVSSFLCSGTFNKSSSTDFVLFTESG